MGTLVMLHLQGCCEYQREWIEHLLLVDKQWIIRP